MRSIYCCVQLFRSLNVLGLEALEATLGDGDVGDKGVQLVHRVFVLVTEPSKPDPHPERNSSNTLSPDGLVQPGVNPHVLGAHLLLSKLLDLLDSPGRLVLEPNPVQPFVHVDGVLTGNDLAHSGSLLLLATRWHFGKREIVSCRSESSNKS